MAYLMFLLTELAGAAVLFGTWKGIFSLPIAFFFMLSMLALSFHVMARKPRPDAISIRMACFAAVLSYASILSLNLAIEGRDWLTAITSLLFGMLTAIASGAGFWSVWERPTDLELGE